MNKLPTLRSLAFAFLALHAAASQACYSAPAAQLVTAAEQLGLATNVALAQVIAATPLGGVVEYRFLTLEQLAGPPQKVFTVMGRAPTPYDKDTAFDRHRDFAFWARGGGRTMNGPDCVIHPSFVVGDSYLVFLGAAPTWRSFEKIEMVDGRPDPDDQWLAYARTALGGAPASRDATPDYERTGRFLYGYQRALAGTDIDPKSLAAQHAPPDLLLRAGQLGAEYARIVQAGVQVPDAELEATLREAAALGSALGAWRAKRD